MSNTATYSPEDNKLRLYVGRVPRPDYDRLRAAGFTATPKQDCDFVATWTPSREDLAREFLEEDEDIGDEDYSPQERAADRAERFEGYREKRLAEATGHADTFDAGPAAFGHQNRARAERQAARHDRHRGRAVSQWSKAAYWQERTAGVIANALYKSSAAVRRSRILRLEAEQRKHEKEQADYAAKFAAWSKVATMDGANTPPVFAEGSRYEFAEGTLTPALRFAYTLANTGWSGEYTHPRNGGKRSLYSHFTDPADPITPAEAAALWLENAPDPADPDSRSARWSDHYTNRLNYERAMLAEEGGSAAAADMEPGGWIGKRQIHAVNRSPVTKRVVSVKIMAPSGWSEDGPLKLKSYNVERLPEGAYRAPTDEERAQFTTTTKARKAEEKASKPPTVSLVNPTDEDAERLQALWNEREKKYEPSAVLRMTQAEYSARSKGSYALCETRTLHACGKQARKYSNMWTAEGTAYEKSLGANVAKVRVKCNGYQADRVIVITDKPQARLPLDWEAIASGDTAAKPTTKPAPVAAEPIYLAPIEEQPAYEDAPQDFETAPGLLFAR